MTVLVAYNDSPQGEAAVRRAHSEASLRKTDLEVLVLTPQDDDDPTPAALAHILDTLSASPSITYRSNDEEPSDAVLDASDRDCVDLVVIGSRKRSAVSKFLLGSTTQRVLLDAAAPVLVVKGSA